MRGQLKLVSERTPYMRAGLAWSVREPLQIDIRDLDGERLRELLDDPVLTVTVGTDDGSFKPLSAMMISPLDAPTLQLMIDAIVAELPPVGADVTVFDPHARLTEIADVVHAGGYATFEDMVFGHATLLAASQAQGDAFAAMTEDRDSWKAVSDQQAAAIVEFKARIVDLEKLAKPTSKLPKPKPTQSA